MIMKLIRVIKSNKKEIKKYRIGPGTKDTPTPVGIFTIVDKKKIGITVLDQGGCS
jgi:hypothetical protein